MVSTMRPSIPDHRSRYNNLALFSIKHGLSNEIADHLRSLAELAPRFFAQQDYKESRHQPYSHHAATEKVEELTPFCAAHTVMPLGALRLPLGNAQNASAITLG